MWRNEDRIFGMKKEEFNGTPVRKIEPITRSGFALGKNGYAGNKNTPECEIIHMGGQRCEHNPVVSSKLRLDGKGRLIVCTKCGLWG